MNGKEFIKALKNIIEEKNIDEDVVYDAMEQGLITAYKKNYNSKTNVKVVIDKKTGEFKVMRYYVVVPEYIEGDEVTDEEGNVTKSTDYALANPKIVSYTPKQSYLKTGEACLSVPEDVKGYVPRHAKITVEGFDVLTNKDVKIVARGFLAICLQHELDHFDGVLYYDHINKEYPLVPIENAMVIE